MKDLKNSIEKLKKCYQSPDRLVKSMLKDDFAFDIALSIVLTAIESEKLTKEEFLKCLQQI